MNGADGCTVVGCVVVDWTVVESDVVWLMVDVAVPTVVGTVEVALTVVEMLVVIVDCTVVMSAGFERGLATIAYISASTSSIMIMVRKSFSHMFIE
ncbi:MAG: hypothetical protein ABIG30_01175 [Candidatus Aenigmatarchaeota archaeon]